jgi:hypothetical protein
MSRLCRSNQRCLHRIPNCRRWWKFRSTLRRHSNFRLRLPTRPNRPSRRSHSHRRSRPSRRRSTKANLRPPVPRRRRPEVPEVPGLRARLRSPRPRVWMRTRAHAFRTPIDVARERVLLVEPLTLHRSTRSDQARTRYDPERETNFGRSNAAVRSRTIAIASSIRSVCNPMCAAQLGRNPIGQLLD